LDQTKEQFATMVACSPVEPKGELVKIILQMLVTDGSLMGTQYPSLQQRSHPVAARQEILADFLCGTNNLVMVPSRLQWTIARPAIRLNV
jgi:hypothetical protein